MQIILLFVSYLINIVEQMRVVVDICIDIVCRASTVKIVIMIMLTPGDIVRTKAIMDTFCSENQQQRQQQQRQQHHISTHSLIII